MENEVAIPTVKGKKTNDRFPVSRLVMIDGVSVTQKFCTVCGTYKPLDCFGKSKTGYEKRQTYCKPCHKEINEAGRKKREAQEKALLTSHKKEEEEVSVSTDVEMAREAVYLTFSSKKSLVEENTVLRRSGLLMESILYSLLSKYGANGSIEISNVELESTGEVEWTQYKDSLMVIVKD